MTRKKTIAALAFSLCASTLSAQTTIAQSTVVGQSGDVQYPVEVVGANGVNYLCETGTSVVNSNVVRLCRRSVNVTPTGGTTAGITGGITGGAGLGGLGTIGSIGAALGAAAVIGAITSAGSTSGTN
jgi:hypothetical protein